MADPFSWIPARYATELALDAQVATKIDAWLQAHSLATRVDGPSSYATEVERLAYCVGHFPIGVATVRSVLRSLPSRRPFPLPYTFFRERLNIVSLGGGPGADLVGSLLALGAVPRELKLYLADVEPGWEPWAKGAVQSVVQQDPFLSLAAPSFEFRQLDLNNAVRTSNYLEEFKDSGPTIFIAHRVVGALQVPSAFTDLLASNVLPDDGMVLVVAPPRHVGHLDNLAAKLDAARRGWIRRQDSGFLHHHGWTVPKDLWDALTHKPEVQADYDALLAIRDLATTLRWPEVGLV